MSLTTQFDIQKRLAVGNSGLIYHALEKQTGLPVALKLLVGSGDIAYPLDVSALMQAWPRLRLISGSHVAQLLEVITDEGETVLVYPYGDGPSLLAVPAERLVEKEEAVDIAAQLVAALRPGERMNWAHGDLKPSNVVLTKSDDGRPFALVLDWGLAAFRARIAEDSLPFTAPERLAGGSPTLQSDLYSVGAVLHFLLTAQTASGGPRTGGSLPLAWTGANPEALKPLRPDLPPKFLDWLKWLLDPRPEKRPDSVTAAREGLASLKPPAPPSVPRALHTRPGTLSAASRSVDPASPSEPEPPALRNPPSPRPEPAVQSAPPAPARAPAAAKRWMVPAALVSACLAAGAAGWWLLPSRRPAHLEDHAAPPAATPLPPGKAAPPTSWPEIQATPEAAPPPPLASVSLPPPPKPAPAADRPHPSSAPTKIAAAHPSANAGPPAGAWREVEIGAPANAGKSTYDHLTGLWTISGGGGKLGGPSDQFHLSAERFEGDGSITAKVMGVENTDDRARAGVIFRDSPSPGAAFASVSATPDGRIIFQWRPTPDSVALQAETPPGPLPISLKLTRKGNSFTALARKEGASWAPIAPAQTVPMRPEVDAGLCATAHNDAALTFAALTRVALLPGDFTANDVGRPDLPGDATRQPGNVWIVHGAGTDIWIAPDQFNFVSRDSPGDETLTAQVTEIRRTDEWAKAGLMFRSGIGSDAAYADVIATSGQGVSFQWRPADRAQSEHSQVPGIPLPVWLRLTRKGAQFWAYYSKDGTHWNAINANPTLQIKAPLRAGFCVSSHNKAQITTAIFRQ